MKLLGARSVVMELERELARLERRLRAEQRRELDARMLELRRYVDGELDAIDRRIDGVLAKSMRALNTQTKGR